MIEIAVAFVFGAALAAFVGWLVFGAWTKAKAAENREEIARLKGRLGGNAVRAGHHRECQRATGR